MKILLSNDDGIAAPGIAALAARLSKDHEICVAAPTENQSATSHAITVHKNITVEHYDGFGGTVKTAWKVGGTPADCVKVYLEALTEKTIRPDLVISGINNGANLGTDVLYSGTVGAALEGFLHNIPAIAVSLDVDSEMNFDESADIFAKNLYWFRENFGENFFCNVNFPKRLSEAVGSQKFHKAKLGHRDYINAFVKKEEAGVCSYHIGGEVYDGENAPDSDVEMCKSGLITVTPLNVDLTARLQVT